LRAGWLLLALWAWSGKWAATASDARCDVEALRCDVICSFPDLTTHCNRCVRRRPMRFGKRAARAGVAVLSRPKEALPRRRRGFSCRRRSGRPRGTASRRAQVPPGLDPVARVSPARAGGLRGGRTGRNRVRGRPPETAPEEDASRRPEDAAPRFSRGSRPSGDAAARGPTRRKRSTVYEIIESLMELLGLETLPTKGSLLQLRMTGSPLCSGRSFPSYNNRRLGFPSTTIDAWASLLQQGTAASPFYNS
ncbi:hypothetical protein C7M84_009855, partial [Penaeus vannamei]